MNSRVNVGSSRSVYSTSRIYFKIEKPEDSSNRLTFHLGQVRFYIIHMDTKVISLSPEMKRECSDEIPKWAIESTGWVFSQESDTLFHATLSGRTF